MKKLYALLLWGLWSGISYETKGQSMIGLMNSNFAGTNGLYANPANAADSRHMVYINLGAAGFNAGNNYLQYDNQLALLRVLRRQTPEKHYGNFGSLDLNQEMLIEKLNQRVKMLHVGAVYHGPAVLFSWDRWNSIGLSTRVRDAFQVNFLSEDLAQSLRYRFRDDNLYDLPKADDDGFRIQAHAYAETAVTYGRVVMDEGMHFLKTGVSFKSVRGLRAGYVNSQRFSYDVPGSDSLLIREMTLDVGYAGELSNEGLGLGNFFPANPVGTGWGADLGVVYEFRPDFEEFKYKMDGKERIEDRQNKYLFKASAALLDVGSLRYDAPSTRAYRLSAQNLALHALDTLSVQNPADLRRTAEQLTTVSDEQTTFRTGLPTALHLQFDYLLAPHFYLNATWMQDLRGRQHVGMRRNAFVAVAPRVEFKWFELSIPMALTEDFFNFNFGTMLRLGPVFVGSDNIGGLVGATRGSGADIYFGAAIPIGKFKKRDRDGDGVSNRLDQCPEESGTWETGGCPDTDGDGIVNSKDACPHLAGPPEHNGCPDTDGDGVIDPKDRCPTVAGLRSAYGCPDTDGDGVPDHEDECPDQPGTEKSKGCPDRDGDGVPDHLDRCPDAAGPAKFEGCPDSDSDGVPDHLDGCPTVAAKGKTSGCPDSDGDGIDDHLDACPTKRGVAKFEGCPDADFDGVPDHQDDCPFVYGTPENKGCPLVPAPPATEELVELTAEEADIVREAFENLEFETGKAVIRDESKGMLIELANLLRKQSSYRLRLDGHTDNVGSEASNLKLSQDRAQAVKQYLGSRGVGATRILTEGYGASRPVDTNTTAEGRQRNRRVEMKIIR